MERGSSNTSDWLESSLRRSCSLWRRIWWSTVCVEKWFAQDSDWQFVCGELKTRFVISRIMTFIRHKMHIINIIVNTIYTALKCTIGHVHGSGDYLRCRTIHNTLEWSVGTTDLGTHLLTVSSAVEIRGKPRPVTSVSGFPHPNSHSHAAWIATCRDSFFRNAYRVR